MICNESSPAGGWELTLLPSVQCGLDWLFISNLDNRVDGVSRKIRLENISLSLSLHVLIT